MKGVAYKAVIEGRMLLGATLWLLCNMVYAALGGAVKRQSKNSSCASFHTSQPDPSSERACEWWPDLINSVFDNLKHLAKRSPETVIAKNSSTMVPFDLILRSKKETNEYKLDTVKINILDDHIDEEVLYILQDYLLAQTRIILEAPSYALVYFPDKYADAVQPLIQDILEVCKSCMLSETPARLIGLKCACDEVPCRLKCALNHLLAGMLLPNVFKCITDMYQAEIHSLIKSKDGASLVRQLTNGFGMWHRIAVLVKRHESATSDVMGHFFSPSGNKLLNRLLEEATEKFNSIYSSPQAAAECLVAPELFTLRVRQASMHVILWILSPDKIQLPSRPRIRVIKMKQCKTYAGLIRSVTEQQLDFDKTLQACTGFSSKQKDDAVIALLLADSREKTLPVATRKVIAHYRQLVGLCLLYEKLIDDIDDHRMGLCLICMVESPDAAESSAAGGSAAEPAVDAPAVAGAAPLDKAAPPEEAQVQPKKRSRRRNKSARKAAASIVSTTAETSRMRTEPGTP